MAANSAPMCISVRQPWAWAILNAGKQIENRPVPDPWRSRVGERIYIHAAKGCTLVEFDNAHTSIWCATERKKTPPNLDKLPRGAIVGTARLIAVVNRDEPRDGSKLITGCDWESIKREVQTGPWSTGPWCLVLHDARPLSAPLPWKGALGWFPGPPDAEATIAAWAAAEEA
jgi:hypothetical protein